MELAAPDRSAGGGGPCGWCGAGPARLRPVEPAGGDRGLPSRPPRRRRDRPRRRPRPRALPSRRARLGRPRRLVGGRPPSRPPGAAGDPQRAASRRVRRLCPPAPEPDAPELLCRAVPASGPARGPVARRRLRGPAPGPDEFEPARAFSPQISISTISTPPPGAGRARHHGDAELVPGAAALPRTPAPGPIRPPVLVLWASATRRSSAVSPPRACASARRARCGISRSHPLAPARGAGSGRRGPDRVPDRPRPGRKPETVRFERRTAAAASSPPSRRPAASGSRRPGTSGCRRAPGTARRHGRRCRSRRPRIRSGGTSGLRRAALSRETSKVRKERLLTPMSRCRGAGRAPAPPRHAPRPARPCRGRARSRPAPTPRRRRGSP